MSRLFELGGQSIGASASVLPINISRLISFRIDWFDLLAVQRTLKSLLQHHNSKVSISWRSKFRDISTGRSFWIGFSDFIMVIQSVSSVAQSCPTLCDPMNLSMPRLPVHHQLLEFTQTHVHRVSDAIQPSHPPSSPSPPALNLSQHQGLFK